jgi:carbonic anhydrase
MVIIHHYSCGAVAGLSEMNNDGNISQISPSPKSPSAKGDEKDMRAHLPPDAPKG